MSEQNMNYLTVQDEDYYYKSPTLFPDRPKHKCRSVSPSPAALSAANISRMPPYDEPSPLLSPMTSTPDLRSVSAMSFYPSAEYNSSTDSSPSLDKKRHRSIENLCFGVRNRKKLHRKAQVNELARSRCYTEPQMKHDKSMKHLPVPILRIPEDELPTNGASTTTRGIGSLLKQTLKVTSASMGFRTTSVERLSPYYSRPLSEDVKQRFSSVNKTPASHNFEKYYPLPPSP